MQPTSQTNATACFGFEVTLSTLAHHDNMGGLLTMITKVFSAFCRTDKFQVGASKILSHITANEKATFSLTPVQLNR